jgi:Holliday junction resolvasome RuvABC endonuclease subunit
MNFVGLKHIADREEKKIEIQKWANSYFKLSLKIEENDIADALAIAVGTKNKIKGFGHSIDYWK